MTTLDTSLYAGLLQPPKSVDDYLSQYAQRDLQQSQLAQNKLLLATGQQNLNEAQAVAGEKNNLRAYLSDPKIDLTTPEGRNGLYRVSPTLAPGVLKTMQDQMTAQALAAKDQGAASESQQKVKDQAFAHYQNALGTVSTPEAAASFITSMYHDPIVGPQLQQFGTLEDGLARLQQQAATPDGFTQWKANSAIGMQKLAEMAKVQQVNTGGTTNTQVYQPATGQVQTVAQTKNTVSPDTLANNATSRKNNADTIAKDLTVAGIDPNNPAGPSAGVLSPAAIENAAARYNLDGTLPPMAMGPRGAVGRTAIMNRAAELAVGTDPTQLRVNQMDAKSAGAALTQLTKAKTMSAAFEDTANQNANLALSLSAKNDRTGIPLLNAGLQAWRTGTGSPEATQFAAANETFVNEYAKIMSGGMGSGPVSDAARSKASSLLTTAMTGGDKGQYAANVKLLQTEMRNRMKGFDDQESALRTRISGKTAAVDASPSNTASGVTVSNW